jgi:hypothetical protein
MSKGGGYTHCLSIKNEANCVVNKVYLPGPSNWASCHVLTEISAVRFEWRRSVEGGGLNSAIFSLPWRY